MEEMAVMKQIGLQFPGLGLAAVMIMVFLKHLKATNESHNIIITSITKENREAMMAINRETLEAGARSREVISHNTAVLAENTATTRQQIRGMEKMTDALQQVLAKQG
jgi:hypothetical protein